MTNSLSPQDPLAEPLTAAEREADRQHAAATEEQVPGVMTHAVHYRDDRLGALGSILRRAEVDGRWPLVLQGLRDEPCPEGTEGCRLLSASWQVLA